MKNSRKSLPGLYFVDVKKAALRLAAGKLAGTCKSCGREFRVPDDFAAWASFMTEMVRHPLEHDNSEEMRQSVGEILAFLKSASRGAGETELAKIFANHLDELVASGAIVTPGRDG